jgi:hypothetical protein
MRILAPIFPTLLADVRADEGLAPVTLARRSADQGFVESCFEDSWRRYRLAPQSMSRRVSLLVAFQVG